MSAEALSQHIMVRGSEGLRPSEAGDIFLFQRLISLKNYHINWEKFRLQTFFIRWRGAKVHSQNGWGHGRTGPLHPPLMTGIIYLL